MIFFTFRSYYNTILREFTQSGITKLPGKQEVIVMENIAILKRTQELLEEVPLGGKDVDSKVRHLLKSEYLRRLSQYRRADVLLTQKYGMSFDEFISRRIVRERGYGWDVESDAMEWETAISGMKTMRRNIEELQVEGRTS